MILFIILPKKEFSSSEKRYLEGFPTLNTETFFNGEFSDDFEVFLSDHTAFRNFWVGLNSYYNLALGNNCSTGIYHCKNGYLINDPPKTNRLDVNVEVISEFAEKTNIPTTVLAAPSTGYIVSDVLPKNHLKYNDDQLFYEMEVALSGSGVNFVNVINSFKTEYNNGTQLYYKTDHHWTSAGAYTAYCALGDYLDYTPHDKSEYHITSYDGFYGTTYSSSGFWLTKPDKIEIWDNKANDDNINVKITDGSDVIHSKDMFFYDNLEQNDKYPVFLDGNHPLTEIENTAVDANDVAKKDSKSKLLIIKDSFAHSLTPFLADHFNEIIMIDLRYYKSNVSDLIKSEDFDQILVLYSIENLATDTDLVWLE